MTLGQGYGPLNQDIFLENTLNSRTCRAVCTERKIAQWRERNHCPASDRLAQEGPWLGQTILLADEPDMEDIAAAIRKVHRHAEALKRT